MKTDTNICATRYLAVFQNIFDIFPDKLRINEVEIALEIAVGANAIMIFENKSFCKSIMSHLLTQFFFLTEKQHIKKLDVWLFSRSGNQSLFKYFISICNC